MKCVYLIVAVLVIVGNCNASDCENGKIENASYKEESGRRRHYKCNPGYVSNIPDLEKIRFKCDGTRRWIGSQVYLGEHGNLTMDTDNVTCSELVQCTDKPPSKKNLTSEVYQYQQKVTVKTWRLNLSSAGYYQGDTITYKCQYGYEEVRTDTDNYYDFDNEHNTTDTLTCGSDGQWNGYTDDIISCQAIECDASKYKTIKNGTITNYKDRFGYLESMELSCDEGFKANDNMWTLLCLKSGSFFVDTFGCEPITCPVPSDPINGYVVVDGNRVGDKASFFCDYDTTLHGNKAWTCQVDGNWDSECVVCEDKVSYCAPPCIPLGAEIISTEKYFYETSSVDFICSGGGNTIRTVNRVCMGNRLWSGIPIQCIDDNRDPFRGDDILAAMKRLPKTSNNDTASNETILARTIEVGNPLGVEIYFLIDVSDSIGENEHKQRKRFIKAILPVLGISDKDMGTRLAFYYFATKVKADNFHHSDYFKNASEVEDYLKKSNVTTMRNEIQSGTAMDFALKDIAIDIDTKNIQGSKSQQVVIIISDGRFNGADPTPMGNILKEPPYEVEIYSILVGADRDKHERAYETMKNLAANNESETRFFVIKDETDLELIIGSMVGNSSIGEIKCGRTDPTITKLFDGNKPIYEEDASKNAWPWMVQIQDDNGHKCGGSLIHPQWILTAAHCLDFTKKVHLRKLKRIKMDEDTIEFPIQDSDKHQYPDYNKNVEPKYLYDIALVKLPREVEESKALLPVCLPNKDELENLFKPEQYGVATGWGKKKQGGQMSATLKQMQMPIKNCSGRDPKEFNTEWMICAGGEVDGNYIDTCQGDSGGPFVVRQKTDETRFTQIAVVSHGAGCKKSDKNGIYTKINSHVLKWINATINTK